MKTTLPSLNTFICKTWKGVREDNKRMQKNADIIHLAFIKTGHRRAVPSCLLKVTKEYLLFSAYPEIKLRHYQVFNSEKSNFFCKLKEIKGLCGGVRMYAAHSIPQIDAEIVEKSHF